MLNKEHFKKEIERLQDQWPKGYNPQRQALIYQALKGTNNIFFTDAINHMLATKRAQPLLPEFETFEREWNRNRSYAQGQRNADASISGILKNAEKYSQADSEIVEASMSLIRGITNGKITHRQFDEGCGVLYKVIGLQYKPVFGKG